MRTKNMRWKMMTELDRLESPENRIDTNQEPKDDLATTPNQDKQLKEPYADIIITVNGKPLEEFANKLSEMTRMFGYIERVIKRNWLLRILFAGRKK